MDNLLYILAVILVIAWAIGFFAYSVGAVIHILLVLAVIAILLRLYGQAIQAKQNKRVMDLKLVPYD